MSVAGAVSKEVTFVKEMPLQIFLAHKYRLKLPHEGTEPNQSQGKAKSKVTAKCVGTSETKTDLLDRISGGDCIGRRDWRNKDQAGMYF